MTQFAERRPGLLFPTGVAPQRPAGGSGAGLGGLPHAPPSPRFGRPGGGGGESRAPFWREWGWLGEGERDTPLSGAVPPGCIVGVGVPPLGSRATRGVPGTTTPRMHRAAHCLSLALRTTERHTRPSSLAHRCPLALSLWGSPLFCTRSSGRERPLEEGAQGNGWGRACWGGGLGRREGCEQSVLLCLLFNLLTSHCFSRVLACPPPRGQSSPLPGCHSREVTGDGGEQSCL